MANQSGEDEATEDARLNEIADARAGGPFVALTMDDEEAELQHDAAFRAVVEVATAYLEPFLEPHPLSGAYAVEGLLTTLVTSGLVSITRPGNRAIEN